MRFALTSDIFNPMLVRDLRQGLRSRRFTGAFLLLQGSLAFFVIVSLMTSDRKGLVGLLNGVLWFGLFIYYFLGLPLMATVAFTPEYRENRIDLLKLTQMSSRGMVWGKWWSLFVQGAMVAVSLLPYVILTYFIGGVELALELTLIGILLGFSALLVGACLAVSCVNLQVFRVLLVLFLIFSSLPVLGALLDAMSGGYAGMFFFGGLPLGVISLLLVTAGLPALYLVLEFGASRLAPFSENHDTPQRYVVFVLLGVVGATFLFGGSGSFWREFLLAIVICASLEILWVMMFAASSEPLPYPTAYRPFVRFGSVGKWLGRILLYPGWPSAVFFITLLAGLELLIIYGVDAATGMSTNWDVAIGYCVLMPPALLFPHLAGQALLRSRMVPGVRYFVMAVGSYILMLIGWVFSSVTGNSIFVVLTCLLPPNAWLFFTFDLPGEINEPLVPLVRILAVAGGVTTMIIMFARAMRFWPKFAELERRAEASLAVPLPSDISVPPAKASPPSPSGP